MSDATPLKKIKPGFQYIDREDIRLTGICKIILTGDIGCTGFNEESKEILDRILRQKTDLFFFLGDLAFTGAEEEFKEIIDFCNDRAQAPIFALCGNHDLPGYYKFFGSSTYVIELDKFVCIFLSNATGYFLDKDIAFLRKELDKHKTQDFIVFMHVPPPTDIDRNHLRQAEWEKLRKELDPYRKQIRHIFCAHIHGYHDYHIDGYHVTITAGGGAAMINDLRKPEQKIHHAVVLNIDDSGAVNSDIITVTGSISASGNSAASS
jgi:predicted MPP superfamily phosphohydrolase